MKKRELGWKKILFVTLVLSAFVAAMASFIPSSQAASSPVPSAKLTKYLKLWAYEKGDDFIGTVGGIFDENRKKIVLKCALKNLTGKEIHGVRGVLRFTTLFGEYICDWTLESTTVVPPGETAGVDWKAGIERFTKKGLATFEKLKLGEMRQIWYPSMIVFSDGTIAK